MPLYDAFGASYSATRREDPRIATQIWWSRPEAYLEPEVQAGMSWIALLPSDARARATARLRDDLESGEWDRRFGHLRSMDRYDAGYRIAIAGPPVARSL